MGEKHFRSPGRCTRGPELSAVTAVPQLGRSTRGRLRATLAWSKVSKADVIAGILVGEVFAFALVTTGPSVLFGLSTGLVAVALNCAITVVISLLTAAPRRIAESEPVSG